MMTRPHPTKWPGTVRALHSVLAVALLAKL